MVSNRLPLSLRIVDGKWSSKTSNGGLASAVSGIKSDSGFLWVGWPGCEVPAALQPEIVEHLAGEDLTPVFLTAEEEQAYYSDYCNQLLWPLFHYFTDKVTHDTASWAAYCEVNRRFADTILAQCQPGDRIWIHDFHLMLVPRMLRAARPDLEIGFFLHIPWPSSEIFRIVPNREELLRGLLGADYVAFHTNDYAHHFRSSCLRVLGLGSDSVGINFENRRIGIGRHPIGIDTGYFRSVAAREGTAEVQQDLRRRYPGRRVVLGIERLDYTKGVPLKLRAFERFLEQDPSRAQSTTLLQVVVPSRLASSEYQDLKVEIEGCVSRINGRFGGPGSTPVEYIHRELTAEQLVALYRFADVGLVTPVRDGMNLVAQEFVLCQQNAGGMLILSEFAGAAQVLGESILVNPWNIQDTADAIAQALDMQPRERDARMGPMVTRVERMDCQRWAQEFLDELQRAAEQSRACSDRQAMGEAEVESLCTSFAAAPRRVVFLDYDGTLRELASKPELAQPTPEILVAVEALATQSGTDLHIVSGRSRTDLDAWFGHLPVHLSCEHGALHRRPSDDWTALHAFSVDWMGGVREMLEEVCREVPGSAIEQKQFSLAWHYRLADLDYGLWRARELLSALEQSVVGMGLDVMSGNKVIEIRSAGVNKGSYVRRVLADEPDSTFVMAIGDDQTDVDMYRALPAAATCIHVGNGTDEAQLVIESPVKVRALIRRLAALSCAKGADAGTSLVGSHLQ